MTKLRGLTVLVYVLGEIDSRLGQRLARRDLDRSFRSIELGKHLGDGRMRRGSSWRFEDLVKGRAALGSVVGDSDKHLSQARVVRGR